MLVLDALIVFLWMFTVRLFAGLPHWPGLADFPNGLLWLLLTVGSVGLADWLIIRRVWRAVTVPTASNPSVPAGSHKTNRVTIAVVLGIVVLGILGATFFIGRPSGPPSSLVSLADSPFELQKRSTAEVIQAGLDKPINPWAWQELERRSLTGAEAGKIMDGLTKWLQQKHPGGFSEPLSWLDSFLNRLAGRRVINQQQELAFLEALHGNLRCEPLPRLREGARTLDVQVACRNIWTRDLFGLTMMNDLRSVTVDGQPVKLQYYLGRWWDHDDLNGRLELPALAPGKHTVKLEVLSAFVTKNDLIGLAPDAPSTDWPTGKMRWIRTAELELLVNAKDAQIVSLTDDPAFDPVANGYLSASQVVIRPKGGHLTAVVVAGTGSKPGQAVSVEVTMRLAGKSYKCGSLMSWKSADGKSTLSSGGELKADLDSLDQQVKEAEIVMTPNPTAVESRPGIDRIWGKEIVFSHVPLTRQDLPGAVTVETASAPMASASGVASESAAVAEPVSYRAGVISFIGLPILDGAVLLLIGLPVAGLIWFLSRKNTTSTGKAVAIGCGVLVFGAFLVLALLLLLFFGFRQHVRVNSYSPEMVAAKAQAEAQMAEARARAEAQMAVARNRAEQLQAQAKADATSTFSPVVERDLTDDTMLGFESGQVEAPPDFVYSSDSTIVGNVNSHLDWMKQKGFDFGFVSGEAICIGPKVILLLPGDLTNLTARTLMRQLAMDPGGGPGAVPLRHGASVPCTFGFQTHSGRMGIMQLTGFANNPRGVKIRYKLVQNGSAALNSIPSPFCAYTVNNNYAELARMANTNTPEGIAARFTIGLLGSDPTATVNRYVIDMPRLPPGAVKITMTEENRNWGRRIIPKEIMIYREELAAVILPQQTNDALCTVILGKRKGEWKVCLQNDLPDAPTLAQAESGFRDRAPEIYDMFQMLPDEQPSLMEEATRELTTNLTQMTEAMVNSVTQMMSQVPGMQIGTPIIQSSMTVTVVTNTPNAASANEEGVYVIASGDTVAKIARRFGLSLADLMAMNPHLVATRLKVGQKVRVSKPTDAARAADLQARLMAADQITAFTTKDKALAIIAQDAARDGNATLARQALDKMTAFTARDAASLEAARALAKAGQRAEAIELARMITSFVERDNALKELAQ
jgi:LysM repeat protein